MENSNNQQSQDNVVLREILAELKSINEKLDRREPIRIDSLKFQGNVTGDWSGLEKAIRDGIKSKSGKSAGESSESGRSGNIRRNVFLTESETKTNGIGTGSRVSAGRGLNIVGDNITMNGDEVTVDGKTFKIPGGARSVVVQNGKITINGKEMSV